jgi:hypothetical protein
MFESKMRIRFLKEGSSPVFGHLYIGKEVVAPKKTALQMIKMGHAEEVSAEADAKKKAAAKVEKKPATKAEQKLIDAQIARVSEFFKAADVKISEESTDDLTVLTLVNEDGAVIISGPLHDLVKNMDDHFAALLGSSVQPALFTLKDGTELNLGAVVRQAFNESGVASVDEWNALAEDARESFIAEVVKKLPLKKPADKEKETGHAGNSRGSKAASKGKSK